MLASPTVKLVQLGVAVVLYHHVPRLLSVAVMAMPVGLVTSTSVMPLIKVETNVLPVVTPLTGAASSSVCSMARTLSTSTGASFVPVMVTVTACVCAFTSLLPLAIVTPLSSVTVMR